MKSICIFILLILISVNSTSAQDTLVMRNNTIVLAKVMEVFAKEVKYKRYDMLDGAVFIESRKNIRAIKYANGFKEEFPLEEFITTETINTGQWKLVDYKIEQKGVRYYYLEKPIGRREVNKLLLDSNDKTIITLALKSERAAKLQYLGIAGIVIGGIASIVGLGGVLFQEESAMALGGGLALVAVPLGITGNIYNHNNRAYRKEAIKLYNQKY